jgi:hypothetical protein
VTGGIPPVGVGVMWLVGDAATPMWLMKGCVVFDRDQSRMVITNRSLSRDSR